VLIDHISLTSIVKGSKFKEMEEISNVLVYYRNLCNFIPVVIQQITPEILID